MSGPSRSRFTFSLLVLDTTACVHSATDFAVDSPGGQRVRAARSVRATRPSPPPPPGSGTEGVTCARAAWARRGSTVRAACRRRDISWHRLLASIELGGFAPPVGRAVGLPPPPLRRLDGTIVPTIASACSVSALGDPARCPRSKEPCLLTGQPPSCRRAVRVACIAAGRAGPTSPGVGCRCGAGAWS